MLASFAAVKGRAGQNRTKLVLNLFRVRNTQVRNRIGGMERRHASYTHISQLFHLYCNCDLSLC
jgi:hypothetical protein